MAIANVLEPGSRTVERLLPGGGAEVRPRIGRIDRVVSVLGHAVTPDHRLREPMRVVHVIEPKAALDAEPVLVGRTITTADRDDRVVLDLVGELAADPAIGADAVAVAIGHALEH